MQTEELHIKEIELVKQREKILALLDANSKALAEIRNKMAKWKSL